MPSDLSSISPEQGGLATRRITMDATVGEVVAVTLPTWCRSVLLTYRTSGGADTGGWYNFNDTDNTAKSDDSFPVASGTTVALGIALLESGDTPTIYLACDSSAGYAYLTLSVLP